MAKLHVSAGVLFDAYTGLMEAMKLEADPTACYKIMGTLMSSATGRDLSTELRLPWDVLALFSYIPEVSESLAMVPINF